MHKCALMQSTTILNMKPKPFEEGDFFRCLVDFVYFFSIFSRGDVLFIILLAVDDSISFKVAMIVAKSKYKQHLMI